MVRFCCVASCWAISGSKVPSQIMGAPQEVQVRTSGRALARVGMGREVHSSTHSVHAHCRLPRLGPRNPADGSDPIPSPEPTQRIRRYATRRATGQSAWLCQDGGCEEGRDTGAHTVGGIDELGVGGVVAPYQRRRSPVKLSLSRIILAGGQVPMGMNISRCLGVGAAVRGMPACLGALSLCSLQGGRAHKEPCVAEVATTLRPLGRRLGRST